MNKKYQIGTAENKAWMEQLCMELLEFGKRFPAPDGSAYYLKEDGTPWVERNRDTYATCRMAHAYSIGAMLGFEGSEKLVDEALRALQGSMRDQEHGGWYAGLDKDNQILPGKMCYAHAFVILAASSAMLIGRPGAEEILEAALANYDEFFWEEENGLASDNWNTEFTVRDTYRGINANMHSVEAFLAAADVAGKEIYRERAGRMIDHVVVWARENDWRIPEHYTDKWGVELEFNREKPDDQFKPYGATPGHGLEWARLIVQWALSSFKEDKEKAQPYIEVAENLFQRAVEDAWNADGAPGIVYTTDWEGKPIVHDRMHWTLCEGINTAAVLWQVTGKEAYAEAYAEFLQYADEKVLDHVNGSWFHQLDQNNQVIGTVWPGKNDIYHALQATLIPYYGANQSIAPAVKEKNC